MQLKISPRDPFHFFGFKKSGEKATTCQCCLDKEWNNHGFIYIVISGWAVNHAILRSHEAASYLSIPAKIFPVFFPFGNMATGFLIIFSLIAGVVGFITSITGIYNVIQWNAPNLHAAAFSSLTTWLLTLLAMGLACKEINMGWTDSNLRTLETMLIILGGTQMFCTAAIHAGIEDVATREI